MQQFNIDMNARLLLLLICFAPHFLFAQDPVRDIDPTMREQPHHSEGRALPRDEIPGTIRETQQDQSRYFSDDISADQPQTSDTGVSDTTSIQFVDENGKVIRNPNAYTRRRIDYAPERRKAADTIEYFPGRGRLEIERDTITKP